MSATETKFCKHCAVKLPEDAEFCPACNKPRDYEPPTPPKSEIYCQVYPPPDFVPIEYHYCSKCGAALLPNDSEDSCPVCLHIRKTSKGRIGMFFKRLFHR